MKMHVPEARNQIFAPGLHDFGPPRQTHRTTVPDSLDAVARNHHPLVWDELSLFHVDDGHPVEHQGGRNGRYLLGACPGWNCPSQDECRRSP